jgi:hypothetical protein
MSRGYGRLERQIMSAFEADQGAHTCVRLETLVYVVWGRIASLGEEYNRGEIGKPVCDCRPYYLPALGRWPLYHHTDACYPHGQYLTDSEVSATQRAVRSLVRKGVLKSIRVGWWLFPTWAPESRGYPGRVTFVWRAETPIDSLPDKIRIAWQAQTWLAEISVACSNRPHLLTPA